MNRSPQAVDRIEQLEQKVRIREFEIRQLKSAFRGFLIREICPYLEIIDEALELDPPRIAVAHEKADDIAFHVNKKLKQLEAEL